MSGTKLHSGVIAAAMDGSDPVGPDGEPRNRIHLLPLGSFEVRGIGKTFTMDKAAALKVIQASQAFLGRTDMVVDFDHQSYYASRGAGNQAAAAGWIKTSSLALEDDGIWADVEWTPAARQLLKDKQYRYLSPVFDDKGGVVAQLYNVALTNSPAIEELAAAAALQHEGTPMDLKKIAAALGLGEDATEAQICAAIAALNTTTASVRAALGAREDEDLVVAAQTLKTSGTPDPSKWAPADVVKGLQDQVNALTAASIDDKATSAVDGAIKAGKITPATRDYWLANAKADLAGFEKYVAASAAIVPPEQRRLAGEPAARRTTLTAQEKQIAASMGLAEDKFLATILADEEAA